VIRLSKTTLLAFIILCWSGIVLPAPSDSDRLQLPFWPGADAAKDARTVAIVDHPCGKVVVARVTVLPSHSKRGALIPEVAAELNARGGVVARWPMPVDSYPIAVEGEKLLLRTGDIKLWVNPRGVVTRYAGKDSIPSSADVPCARTAGTSTSEYVVCRSLPDLRSGRNRIVRFESPCT
jgi:hypothetical protein